MRATRAAGAPQAHAAAGARFMGHIARWEEARGFGFIEPAEGGDPVFVHARAFGPAAAQARVGLPVAFEVERAADGRKRARRVFPVPLARPQRHQPQRGRDGRPRHAPASAFGTATLFCIPALVALLALLSAVWRLPRWVMVAYLVMSALCFMAYASDKGAARAGRRRTPESTLHALALLGGWPGALCAQQWLRHKSVKREFRQAFWCTVLANTVLLVALASPWLRDYLPAWT